ncbi:hypothetical protein DITRI_Ditri14bG0129300 [Diplodiscus trichospermus]
MAKLTLLLATFALVLFLANASIYRTTITVDNDQNRPGRESSCEQQIRQQSYLEHCQRYIEENCSSRSYNRPSRHLDSCCEQLQNLDRQCRCPGLERAVQKQLEESEFGREEEEKQEMYQVAEKLLEKCEVEPRRCQQSRDRF